MKLLIAACALVLWSASGHASFPGAPSALRVSYSYSCDDPYTLTLDVRNRGPRPIAFPNVPRYFVDIDSYAYTRRAGLRTLPVLLPLSLYYVTEKTLKSGESYRTTVNLSPYVSAEAGDADGVLVIVEFEHRPDWAVPVQLLNLYYPRPRNWLRRDCPIVSGGPGRLPRVNLPLSPRAARP
ncbi:hypothetical protein IEQ11_19455 [Lysobacter capsici]|uniref:hypothetical protein n=1 Tax=Lysobacter capsici TaxID=435897 RepID=UPI00177D5D20|nr:hypothetical protein [Lysobacter capsici]UOF13892.1 hypothetical protein IEQ11_19455 [Lysobacter capsici]